MSDRVEATIPPELRDIIIETHTLVKRMDKEHDEHKEIINGRIKGIVTSIKEEKAENKELFQAYDMSFKEHDERIKKQENFRTRVIAYVSVITVGVGIAFEFFARIFTKA